MTIELDAGGLWRQVIVDFGDLHGKTLRSVTQDRLKDENDAVLFETTDGQLFLLTHNQDCCEKVSLEDVAGSFDDLIGVPITLAEEVSKRVEDEDDLGVDSQTWTYYKLGTVNGYVTLRWYGSSNGYYSEEAALYLMSDRGTS